MSDLSRRFAALWSDPDTRAALYIVAAGTGLRLVLAATIGLGVDESYAVTVSRQLAWSYFDHPPLSFWIPGIVQRLGGPESTFLLRLPFILLFAGTTWIMFRLAERLFSARAGVYAALLLNITPVFALSTGGWILPDGPLVFAIVAAALYLARIFFEPSARPRRVWIWWLGAGVMTGVAFLSKYHAVFLVLGCVAFMVTEPGARRWFRRPEPYAAALIAVAMLTPVIAWNYSHAWASFRFQGARASARGGPPLHLQSLAQNIAGQAGYLTPWIWIPLVAVAVHAARAGPRDARRWFLLCLALGPILAFTAISLRGNPGLPHWPAPGYLLLLPLLADAMSAQSLRPAFGVRLLSKRLALASGAFLLLVAVAASQVATGWVGTLAPSLFRRGDPSLEAVDWRDLPPELARYRAPDSAAVVPAFVAAENWIDAAKIGYALGPSVPILCLSDDQRHFAYLYDRTQYLDRGLSGLLVVRAEHGATPATVMSRYASRFSEMRLAGPAAILRAGRSVIELWVYRVRGRPGPSRAALDEPVLR